MKSKVLLLMLVLVVALIGSCKPSPEKLFQKYQQAAVIIRHSFLYKVEIGPNVIFYINDPNSNKFYLAEEKSNCAYNTIYGTGFFVSTDGKIVTNKHIASPLTDEVVKNIQETLLSNVDNNETKYDQELFHIEDSIRTINDQLRDYNYDLEFCNDLVARKNILENKRMETLDLKRSCSSVKRADIKVSIETYKLGYAINNTHIKNDDDYTEIVTLKVSDNPDIDLAVLQTKNKKLPQDITEIVVDESRLKEDPKVNDNVFMIGYNLGEKIANSSQGIQVQFTKGTISQIPDGNKVMYTIPSLPGSSGSPVIDDNGKLVAVHFSGYSGTQSFNYGILGKHLLPLLK